MFSQVPSGFSITGGIPTKSQDLAASIIFTIAYACLVPFVAWRLASKASRTTTMIRPAIFVLVRTATYIMRAVQSNGDYSETLFIVEQVFLLAGFPIICDAILTLLEYHITRTHTSPKQGQTTQRVCRLLRLALLMSSVFNDPSKASQLRTLRNVNAALCLAIVIGVIVVVLVAQVHKDLPSTRPCFWSSWRAACPPFSIATKVKFYVLLALMEWLVTAALFSVNARVVFGEDLAKEKNKAAKEARAVQDYPMQQGHKDPYTNA
ncbi:hypothetical protein RHS01_08379 [Rhizoctonia solani]|uniref:Transmembrane protein n=1 Tax=Rhizoctonia solani TaxID=456999 RepID=A0A8H7IB98_9AGAM|nr:hypothetical protein RHS01_08379 [Rhizoctonia solani]